MAKVTVVIPNYNYERYVGEAIDSALGQTHEDIEVIVIDDGSSDSSRDVLEGYVDRINVIFRANQGVAAARNSGAAASTGSYIAFLDADDIWLPGKIETQLAIFEADPMVGMVHVGMVEIDEHGKERRRCLEGLKGWVADELLQFDHPVILGGGSGIMIRRDVFNEIGGFDERMSTSADWDLYYRIASRYPVGFVPEVLLKYRVHGSNMHSNIRAMERDMMLGFDKAFEQRATADRRVCYGNLHKTLAGSYFHAGQYMPFIRHSVLSLVNRPANVVYFAAFFNRRAQRR